MNMPLACSSSFQTHRQWAESQKGICGVRAVPGIGEFGQSPEMAGCLFQKLNPFTISHRPDRAIQLYE
jgi:hypothetical protein